jgi:hypothetical protein
MPDTLIFIDEYSKRLRNELDSLCIKKDSTLFCSPNVKTLLSLQAESFQVFPLDETLTKEDIEDTTQQCLDFIHSTFVTENSSPFLYKGIPMGYLISYYLIPYFMRLFRNILYIQKTENQFKHGRTIIIGTGDFAETARMVLQQQGVPYISRADCKMNRFAAAVKRFWEGRKNLWVATPLREFLVEPLQNYLLILESFPRAIRRLFLRQTGTENPSKKYLIFSADHHTFGVYNNLKKNNQWDFIVCGNYYRFRKKLLAKTSPFEEGFEMSMFIRAVSTHKHFRLLWTTLDSNQDFKRRFEFRGVNYWSRAKKLIKYNVLITFPRLFLDYLIAINTFKQYPRSVLFVFDDQPPFYKTLIYAARVCGVKSIIMQHGVLAGIIGRDNIHADFYAAWGPRAIDWYTAHSTPDSVAKIHITGAPRYDSYVAHGALNKREILKSLNLPQDRKLILIFTEWAQDYSIKPTYIRDIYMCDAVIDAIGNVDLIEQCHVIIKPHPTGDIDLVNQYYRVKKDIFPHITIITDHLTELLFAADICVGTYSSCILEAMFFEKPSIVFDHLPIKEGVPFVSRGAALGASNKEEMAVAIKRLLFDKTTVRTIVDNQKKYIEYAIYKFDGKSTERVSSLIENIISGEKIPGYIEIE